MGTQFLKQVVEENDPLLHVDHVLEVDAANELDIVEGRIVLEVRFALGVLEQLRLDLGLRTDQVLMERRLQSFMKCRGQEGQPKGGRFQVCRCREERRRFVGCHSFRA